MSGIYNRMAITIVRIVAAGFFVVGLLELAADLFKSWHNHESVSLWSWLGAGIPLVIGVAILVKSSALARRVDEYLDE